MNIISYTISPFTNTTPHGHSVMPAAPNRFGLRKSAILSRRELQQLILDMVG